MLMIFIHLVKFGKIECRWTSHSHSCNAHLAIWILFINILLITDGFCEYSATQRHNSWLKLSQVLFYSRYHAAESDETKRKNRTVTTRKRWRTVSMLMLMREHVATCFISRFFFIFDHFYKCDFRIKCVITTEFHAGRLERLDQLSIRFSRVSRHPGLVLRFRIIFLSCAVRNTSVETLFFFFSPTCVVKFQFDAFY